MSCVKRASPSVTMSRPAIICSFKYTDSASSYCLRNRVSTIACRNDLSPRFSVYQLGRGREPVMVVGNSWFAVTRSIVGTCLVFGSAQGRHLSESRIQYWRTRSPTTLETAASRRRARDGRYARTAEGQANNTVRLEETEGATHGFGQRPGSSDQFDPRAPGRHLGRDVGQPQTLRAAGESARLAE